MIKVVAFDIGNTIYKVDIGNTVSLNLSKIFNLPKEKVKLSYKKIFNKNNYSLEKLTKMLCKELDVSKYNEVLKYFKNICTRNKKSEYIDENILGLIKDLKNVGIKVVLNSNSNILHKNLVDKDLDKLVDFTFRTYQVGYQKEDEAYYRYIEKKLNVKSEEIINIGDNLFVDYEMPKRFGWNAILFNNKESSISNVESLRYELKKYITF